jgi:hypothetical protein
VRFRSMARVLQRVSDANAVRPIVDVQDFNSLDEFSTQFEWTDWSRELMARSAITWLHLLPEDTRKDVLQRWMSRLPTSQPDHELSAMSVVASHKRLLSFRELKALRRRDSQQLTATQVEWVLRSALSVAGDAERDDLRYWTEALLKWPEAPRSN